MFISCLAFIRSRNMLNNEERRVWLCTSSSVWVAIVPQLKHWSQCPLVCPYPGLLLWRSWQFLESKASESWVQRWLGPCSVWTFWELHGGFPTEHEDSTKMVFQKNIEKWAVGPGTSHVWMIFSIFSIPVISWFRFAPVTIVISTINHSYWSYVHQLNAILGASHCRDLYETRVVFQGWLDMASRSQVSSPKKMLNPMRRAHPKRKHSRPSKTQRGGGVFYYFCLCIYIYMYMHMYCIICI